ncbi:MAG: putative phage tail protein [Fusobacteriaceae bacterium]
MRISSYISKASRNSHIVDILKSNSKEFLSIEDLSKLIENENFILSCNLETIEKWEEFFKLKKQPSWTLQDRIERVIYTKNGHGTFTLERVKENSRIFTNGEVDIEEKYSEYHFTIKFISVVGNPPNLENFIEFIETNKPSHLSYELIFRYRTHKELEVFTHYDLQKFTHQEIFEKDSILKGGKYG